MPLGRSETPEAVLYLHGYKFTSKKCCVSMPFSDKIKYAWNICKLNQTHAFALFRSVIIKARIHLHWISVDCEFWGLPLVLLELSFSSQVLCSFTSPEKDTKHRSHGELILKQIGVVVEIRLGRRIDLGMKTDHHVDKTCDVFITFNRQRFLETQKPLFVSTAPSLKTFDWVTDQYEMYQNV